MAGYTAPFYLNPVPALLHGLVKGSVLVVGRYSFGLVNDGARDEHNEHDRNSRNDQQVSSGYLHKIAQIRDTLTRYPSRIDLIL